MSESLQLPTGVHAIDFGVYGVFHTWKGYVGPFFDADGRPNDEWTNVPRVPAEIHGYGPSDFPWFIRAYARAMRVDAERLSVRQTHRFAGDVLLDGEPLRVPLAVFHAFCIDKAKESCSEHGVLHHVGCDHRREAVT